MQKGKLLFHQLLFMGFVLIVASSCKKDDVENNINTFSDTRDGSVYKTVKIGNQIWMAENLKYLPSVVSSATGSQTTPYYYVYGYFGTNVTDAKSIAYYTIYGVLYNWTAACNSCPTGWHLPSDAEWTQLTDFLGGKTIAGEKLKEAGTTHWGYSEKTVTTNETGFTALPGGGRGNDGWFAYESASGYWWTATEHNSNDAWCRSMYHYSPYVENYSSSKELGFSVRCVRD